MLDSKFVRENPEAVREGLGRRGMDVDMGALARLDASRRDLIARSDALKAQRNRKSKEISLMKKKGQDVAGPIAETRRLGDSIRAVEAELASADERYRNHLLALPNLPHATVPSGKGPQDNRLVRSWDAPHPGGFPLKDHVQLGESLRLFDFPRGAKLSGRGFVVFTGLGAKLERSLIQYCLDVQTEKNGFVEVLPPLLVGPEAMLGTGQLPKMEEDMYRLRDDDLYLIPTAEVPVTNLHAGEVLDADSLPLKYVAYTPCFRREAGAWGRDTRGLQRMHQFDKVEMVQFCPPEESYQALEKMVEYAEGLLQSLEIQYRVVELCAGDLGFSAAKCYDLEVYAPAAGAWLEVSSVSNYEDFQARRANIRLKTGGKPVFLHTLNGSGLAMPRLMVALLETHQQPDGTVALPEPLGRYLGRSSLVP